LDQERAYYGAVDAKLAMPWLAVGNGTPIAVVGRRVRFGMSRGKKLPKKSSIGKKSFVLFCHDSFLSG
jgi:hypothetical protein